MKSDYIKFFSKAVFLAAQLNVASMAINAHLQASLCSPFRVQHAACRRRWLSRLKPP